MKNDEKDCENAASPSNRLHLALKKMQNTADIGKRQSLGILQNSFKCRVELDLEKMKKRKKKRKKANGRGKN